MLSYFVSVDFVFVAYGLLAALIVWALSMAIKRYVLSYAPIAILDWSTLYPPPRKSSSIPKATLIRICWWGCITLLNT
ncbi:hypothetical protein CLI75_11690 [Porphyromonas gingivalis]|nr:hypothetical protein CLI75_11690 [Porphyromonas gingivalis]